LHVPFGAPLDFVRRFEIFRQYGNFTMAYATLQPQMQYFEAHGGYLAYDTCWGVPFVLADPVAPPEKHAVLIEEFVRKNPRACFCQISKPVGAILDRLGWFINEFGADQELDLPTYDFAGPKKSKLRQAANKIAREGYAIEERSAADGDDAELEALCAAWLARKTVKREGRFLVRPIAFGAEPGVRKFYLLDPQGWIVSFVVFDPICEAGEVIGYSPSVKRHSADAPTGAEEALTKFAIEQFQAEGLQTLRLGLLPLYQVEDSAFREAWLLKKFLQWIYRHGDGWIYGFRGLADFKHRYRGHFAKVYFATPRRRNLPNLIAMLRLCRLL
jgi:phosphatidylglycerol lysyltransferase